MRADAASAETFGPYVVYERLGVGGMATVHRALERSGDGAERVVALKRLLPHLAEDANFIKSFVREAKLASLLSHVNIVQLFELGRVGTEYFISMEYIDGCDLRRILRHGRRVTGPPPIHVTVGLLLQLCDALDYAHGRVDEHGHPLGLVHRDVSPSNLLVTRAGHLKIIDFGIARAQSAQLRTQTNRVKGKLAYMAPEAVAGKELDARTDLFAAGVVAHELLTARPLFAGRNEYQTLLKLQRGEIMPPSTYNPACPPDLDAVVLRALARDPNERCATAAELRGALQEVRRRHDLQTGHREIAQWIAWALSLELPSGGFGTTSTLEHTGGNLAQASGQDDAVEIAWGGGEGEAAPGPVVLEDVPDVSGKHLAGATADDLEQTALKPSGELGDLAGELDDIPAPQPSHGAPRARRVSSGLPGPLPAPGVAGAGLAGDAGASRSTLPGHGPRPRSPAQSSYPHPDGAADAAARGDAAARAAELQVPAVALETMRNLPPVPASAARVRADSVAPRDLPSLEPFLGAAGTEVGGGPAGGAAGDAAALTLGDDDDLDLLATAQRRRPARVSIGAAIVARGRPRRRWALLAAVVVTGGLGGAAALVLSRRAATATATAPGAVTATVAPTPPAPPARTAGTVKFATVPEDAEIAVEGQPAHPGSPWAIELPAGVHQIAIQRSGYKAWLTSLELSAGETQTLRVVLEPLGGAAAAAEATLILSTTPPGLEVVLDGQLLGQRTPIRMPIKPGRHAVSVRQDGVEVWRHEVDARASVDYEFTPSMTEDKQRERAARASGGADHADLERPRIVDVDRAPAAGAEPPAERAAEHHIDSPALPAIPAASPEAPAAPTAARPPIIAPTAVTRTGGDPPVIAPEKLGDLPPVITAKVCIDTAGRVSAVDVLSKLDAATAADLAGTLRGWTYTPYKPQGVATPACLVVSFRPAAR